MWSTTSPGEVGAQEREGAKECESTYSQASSPHFGTLFKSVFLDLMQTPVALHHAKHPFLPQNSLL